MREREMVNRPSEPTELFRFDVVARVRIGSLGVVASIAARHGLGCVPLSAAAAGIGAALLAAFGVDRLFGAFPRGLVAALRCGLAVAGLVLLVRVFTSGLAASVPFVTPLGLRALMTDSITLALVMSFEASVPRAPTPASLLDAGRSLAGDLRTRETVGAVALVVALVTYRPGVALLFAIAIVLLPRKPRLTGSELDAES